MYKPYDKNNVELPKQIEPEYSAIWNSAKKELAIFYNGDIDTEYEGVDTLHHAERIYEDWYKGMC